MPNPKPEQDIMNEGPGMRARVRETNAVLNATNPAPAAPAKPVAPSPKERVNPKGAPYGSRGGEKRIDTSDMAKPLGSFKKGTDYVPKTGNYKLHEGEAVVSKEKNMASNPYKMVTDGDKKPKKVLKEIRTRKAKDGSYIHEHHHHHPMHKMEEHTSPDEKGMMDHMAEHAPTIQAEQPEEQTGAQAQDASLGMSPAQ